MKQKQTGTVLSQREIAPDIFDMWIETALSADAKPGQFLGIYPKDRATLLPRPISICETGRITGDSAQRVRLPGNSCNPPCLPDAHGAGEQRRYVLRIYP